MSMTAGKVHQTPGQLRVTFQPDIGTVWRTSGVDRKSKAVEAQNRKFGKAAAGNRNAAECGHKGPNGGATPRKQFFSCLRIKGMQLASGMSGRA